MATQALQLASFASLVDTNLLNFTEEPREGLNKGRLIQGDPSFEKDAQLNNTFRYLGGIGLSTDNLSEEILKKASGTITLDSGDYAVFEQLEVVVLASARIRRFFAEVEGVNRLMCGTNQDGANAKGWSGTTCQNCKFFPKNFEGKKLDACQASIPILVYIPSLNHTAVLEFRGASYMEATGWLDQVGKLSKAFAQCPEIQAAQPGLPRVNSYFFKTTLSASEFKTGNDNNKFQVLKFNKTSAPFPWSELVNAPDVIKKVSDILKSMEEAWKRMYVEANTSAVLALSSSEPQAVAALPGTTVEKVTIAEPVQDIPAQAVPVEAQQAPPVATAVADDDEDSSDSIQMF